jgi:hypothetical protein
MTTICEPCWHSATHHGHAQITDLELYRHEHAIHVSEPCS